MQSLYYHITGRLGFRVSSAGQLGLGDIVQFDLDKNGTLDHSAIVTSIDVNGKRYVSYHTTNKRDVMVDSVVGNKVYLRITY